MLLLQDKNMPIIIMYIQTIEWFKYKYKKKVFSKLFCTDFFTKTVCCKFLKFI